MLIQYCTNVVQRCINVVLTLFQRRTLTLYQRCATLKIRRRILFHFQRRINVNSTLIHNVKTTLIRHRNVGWVVPIGIQTTAGWKPNRLTLWNRYNTVKVNTFINTFTFILLSLIITNCFIQL